MKLTSFLLAACAAFSGIGMAHAGDPFPNKPIRLLVPSTPGTGSDVITRLLSTKLKETVGWTVVVENKAGASGTLALGEAARTRPDGYDWVIGLSTNVALAPPLMKLSFDPQKDLVPAVYLLDTPLIFLVAHNSTYATWKNFADASKAGKPLTYGSFGAGSSAHVAGELLGMRQGLKLPHVPYKGSSLALTDLMGGHIDSAIASTGSALNLLQGGKLRALAVTSARRSTILPSVPTFAELGYEGFDRPEWYGIFLRTGTPSAVVDRIHEEVNKVLRLPDVTATLHAQGQEPRIESRAAFESMVRADAEASAAIIAKAGIKIE